MDLHVRFNAPNAPTQFARTMRETGFAVLTHHPISTLLISETYREWSRFFATTDKERYLFDPQTYWGYYPFLSENAKDRTVKDLKEFFHIYSWSPIPDGMSDRTRRLFEGLDTLAGTLLGWLEDNAADADRSQLVTPLREMIADSRRTVLRVLHYPPLVEDVPADAVRASAHEDINLLTLLPAGTAPGLEVQDSSGGWIEVDCDPTSIVVNSGDMLATATGGYYPSTTHRVVNPVGEARKSSRYSMPLFLHPRPEVRLSDRYTADEFLNERLTEIGLRADANAETEV